MVSRKPEHERRKQVKRAEETVYEILTGEDEGRVCRDIPETACKEQPRNFLTHMFSLSATKIGDGLADPKLVLSWLLGALGAPSTVIGWLVPVREAGALLPQLFTSATIRSMPQRKWAWSVGSLGQGLAVLGMAAAALTLEGAAAGWTIVGLLALFAISRSVCSVSYKDVLGKTISKATRGTVTGSAGTVAAAFVLLFGAALSVGLLPRTVDVIAIVLLVAGMLWIASALLFSTLAEQAGAIEGGGNPVSVAFGQLRLLKNDMQLVRFIVIRGLLMATALAPPYILALAGRTGEREFGELGLFVVASSLAAILSTYIWGRLSDVSSRRVLMYAARIAALAMAGAAGFGWSGIPVLRSGYVLAGILFVLMVAYQGVRLGRSTHIVDMATPETRAAYTALSNTVIGILLLLGGVFGLVARIGGYALVMALFAAMCLVASFTAAGLHEEQVD